MTRKKAKTPLELRGQLMLQTSAGRYFRPGIELNEYSHRRTIYSNVWFPDPGSVNLPVGKITGVTDRADVSSATLEAVDRLEAQTWDGQDDFVIATGGDELIDDVAYVMTFALNRTFSRNHDQVHRLVPAEGLPTLRHTAASLFPRLFEPAQIVQQGEWDALRSFMTDLLQLDREEFARVMRVIRITVDATKTAIDDPTGAYTNIVAALESLGEEHLSTPTTWDRYDPAKRKIINAALESVDQDVALRLKTAVLEADRAGLKRRFVTSTLAHISPTFYRAEAVGTIRPPQAAVMEQMLTAAYNIRSRRSHVLQDLGGEAWVFTDGAETSFEGNFDQILTLAGLWRLTRHVVKQFVNDAAKVEPEPWDYRGALPGQIQARLAPQYWISQADGFDAASAPRWFEGVAEAMIAWLTDNSTDGFNLNGVVEKIEQMVPRLPEGETRTTMIAAHVLWHEWLKPDEHLPTAARFTERHQACLDRPSPQAYTVGLLSNRRPPTWTVDEWVTLANERQAARRSGKESPLPAKIDALIQLEAADHLEAAGRHEEATILAAYAVEEVPGNAALLAWEAQLLAGDHDPDFNVHEFLFGTNLTDNSAETPDTSSGPTHDAEASPVDRRTTGEQTH